MNARNARKQAGRATPKPLAKGGFAEIAIVIVVLVLAGLVGAYYLGRTTTKPSPSPSSQVPPSPKQDETANWRTYTNEKHGFSLKYPNMWFTGISGDGTILLDNEPINSAAVVEPNQVAITIEVITDPQLISLYTNNKSGISETKSFNSLSFEVITLSSTGGGPPPMHVIFAQTQHKQKLYRLGLTDAPLLNPMLKKYPPMETMKVTFNEILSTFKFLD